MREKSKPVSIDGFEPKADEFKTAEFTSDPCQKKKITQLANHAFLRM